MLTVGPSMLENFENKTLDELKETMKCFNLKEVPLQLHLDAFLVKMIKILLDKVENIENVNKEVE